MVVGLVMIAAAACAARPMASATGPTGEFDPMAFCSDYFPDFPDELRDRRIDQCAPEDRETLSLMAATWRSAGRTSARRERDRSSAGWASPVSTGGAKPRRRAAPALLRTPASTWSTSTWAGTPIAPPGRTARC
jgi:hypothetical protein